MSIVAIAPKPTLAIEIKEACVKYLEEALEEAKRGAFAAVLLVVRYPDGSWSFKHTGAMNFPEALGTATYLNTKVGQQLFEGTLEWA